WVRISEFLRPFRPPGCALPLPRGVIRAPKCLFQPATHSRKPPG
ncbi:MAG: hypothetical protein AVDCRST_MAG56-610, partial [uncultured Cytophagales bacterium]